MKLLTVVLILAVAVSAQDTSPIWHEQKIKNYLPHMTWPEVQALLERTDLAIIPVPSLEQHGPQGPIGTDFLTGNETAKLIAQKVDALVVPVLLPGVSPYHMEFPGTITLSPDTVQRVYFETAQSLIHHGIRRILLLNSHAGNVPVTNYIVARINQETPAVALELGEAAATISGGRGRGGQGRGNTEANSGNPPPFDRHGGVGETSSGLYLYPSLMEMDKAGKNEITLPEHLQKILPQVRAGDPVATAVFLAEGLKPLDTGKHTSTREMTATGPWSERDTHDASAERGKQSAESTVNRAVEFINRWTAMRPVQPLSQRQQYTKK